MIADPAGQRAVLKWSSARDWAPTVLAAAPVVAAARASGWPTPAWLAVGQTDDGYPYHVQDFVEGTTQETVSHGWLDLTLPVVTSHAGLGRDGMRNWSRYDHDVVYAAGNDNRVAVASSGPAGAYLSDVITLLNGDHEDVKLPADDLVHGDLNPENVLIANGQVAALIDVEAVGRGTRLHDLTTLLLYAALWGDHDVQDQVLTASHNWFRDLQPWVDFDYAQSALFNGALTTQQWTHLAFTATIWLIIPMTIGLTLVMKDEVK